MPLRRRQRAQGPSPDAAPGTGMLACPLCGEVVPVGDDGRCDLGHRVLTPPSASERTQPLPLPAEHGEPEERADTGEAGVPVAPVAGQAAEGLSLAQQPADSEDGPQEDGPDEDGPPDLDLTRELDW